MQSILTRQNEEKNINKLCASKQIYVGAKRIFMLQILLTVPITIFLSLTKLILSFWHIDISAYVVAYGIGVAVSDLILITPFISEIKKNGAKVQELFDCAVYELKWHRIVVGKKPEQELINKASRKFKLSGKPIAKLYDWYPEEIAGQPALKSIVLCQKTNLNYDSSIRKLFKNTVLVVGVGTLLLLTVFALIQNYSVKNFFIQLGSSFLPVFVLAIKIFIDQNKTLKSSEELKGSIEGILEDSDNISEENIRSVQDRIYTNRKDSGLVPEFFYDQKRDKLEDEMHDNASNY